MAQLGTNVQYSLSKDGILTITIDTNERHGISGSGKSEKIASTDGNKPISETGIVVGLNVYTPIRK
jgi:hypothetical protein